MPKCTYSRTTDYGHTMLNPQFFAAQIQIPAPNKYLGFGHEDLVCRNNGLFIYLSNMDKELTVPKWVLMNCSKIPPNDPKFVCPSPKVWDIDLKRLNWASVGRVLTVQNSVIFVEKLLNIKFIRTMLTNPPYLLLLCFAYPNRGRATAFNRVSTLLLQNKQAPSNKRHIQSRICAIAQR